MKKRMKRYKKTYAIYHLTEKHTVFYLGKTKVHVSFTGGIVTKKGVTPATFTTEDPIVQLAIENSADFRKGGIKLAGQYALAGEVAIGGNERKIEQKEEAIACAAAELEGEPFACAPARDQEGDEASGAFGASGASGASAEEFSPCDKAADADLADRLDLADGASADGAGASGMEPEVVEVSCKDVAKQYLQEHFNENPTPLRTIALVQECAAKYGIVFKFV